jgi:signal transduction histidine kinase
MTTPADRTPPGSSGQPAALEHRLLAAQAAARDAMEALAARDALIASISRELRNKLAPVLLAVDRLRGVVRSGDAARIDAGLDMVERACAAFVRRSQALLDFADMTGGLPVLATGPVDVSALVTQAASRHAQAARRAGCAVNLSLAPGLMALANEDAAGQVIDHMLSNAFRFGAGRPVTLAASARGASEACIFVRDEGPGVPAEAASRIFGLFKRGDDAAAPGLGIGLWLSSQLARAMGGQLVLAGPGAEGLAAPSPLGQGACFALIVPALFPAPAA